jgi:hypothetical protein
MPERPQCYRRLLAAAALMGVADHAVADEPTGSVEPPGARYYLATPGEFGTVQGRADAERPPAVLTLPGTDWHDAGQAESVRNWGAPEDLAGGPLAEAHFPVPWSPAELASQGVAFGHSSLANSGPGLRHGARAGRQFDGLAKGMALNLGNLALGEIAGRMADWLSDH